MGALIGIILAFACMLGGFFAMGGKLGVLWQPWEYVIIIGIAAGTFIAANPLYVVKDTGKACVEAIFNKVPTRDDNVAILHLLFSLLSVLKKSPKEAEPHFDTPSESKLFLEHPRILANKELTEFISDYGRLIAIGNGNTKPHEIEGLMEQDINTRRKDALKPYYALNSVAEALPAIGIVAAVLGIVKAMGAISQSPEILGALIASALIGTFAGIFIAYALVAPLATKVKSTREKQIRIYMIVKQAYVASLNGANPMIAAEYGRKGISPEARPTIDQVENATLPTPSLKVVA